MMIRMSPQSETSWGLTTSDRLKQTCTNKLFLIDVWWSPIIATSDGFANWDNCTHHQDLWTSQQMINFSFRDDRKSFNHMTTCDYNHFLMSFAPIWPLHTFQFHLILISLVMTKHIGAGKLGPYWPGVDYLCYIRLVSDHNN